MSDEMVLKGFDPAEVERTHMAMADFLCWATGFTAALHDDEMSRRGIVGRYDVMRGREILQALRPIAYALTPTDRLAQEIHEALKTPLGMRAVVGVKLGEDAADQLAEAVEEMRRNRGVRIETSAASIPKSKAGEGFAMTPGNFEVGRKAAAREAAIAGSVFTACEGQTPHGWVVWPEIAPGQPSGIFPTAEDCAQHIATVGGNLMAGRAPAPLYAEPRGPAMPAEGIVGWMVERPDSELRNPYSPARRLFCDFAKAMDWRTRSVGYREPRPVYATPNPEAVLVGWLMLPLNVNEGEETNPEVCSTKARAEKFRSGAEELWSEPEAVFRGPPPAPDWPREISVAMAENFGETLSLALQGGADHPGAAKAVLDEFMRSHRPPAGDLRKFGLGDRVDKVGGASWRGPVVGFYSTRVTPAGYVIESEREPGSVHVLPEAALRPAPEALAPVDADFGEVPFAYGAVYRGYLVEDLLRARKEDAKAQAPLDADRVIPLYRSPEPPHLSEPSGWLATTDRGSALFRTEAAAREWFDPALTVSVVPLYALA